MASTDGAFPEIKSDSHDPENYNVTNVWSEGGLTKREYFAASIMTGLVSVNEIGDPNSTAFLAVEFADALIEELERTENADCGG